ncbi:uncharacterized protein METZ01_LOCUS316410, partial [marine metagenome]
MAVARRLAFAGRDVIVLETEDTIGTQTSSRNSEVIHAGIYYPTNSLKAVTCVAGKNRLYRYCSSHGVPHLRLGKLIVATNESQLAALEELKLKAAANGVPDLDFKRHDEIADMEPAIHAVGALLSPSTGIIDSHSLMLAYQGDAEDHGAMIAFNSPVTRGKVTNKKIELTVKESGTECTVVANIVVNAAGLGAQRLAHSIAGLSPETIPERYLARGCYFTVSGKSPFTRLIYPVPEPGGLGVHVTLDMGGSVRFGPDVEWIDNVDYEIDPKRADSFYSAIRKYYPQLEDGALQPGYAGIRPKIKKKGSVAGDFLIQGSREHGIEGLVNMYGIESPGLTASLALADIVAQKVGLPEVTDDPA